MDDVYTELRGLPELGHASLNAIVSQQHALKRPPSLSDSFATTPENIDRASVFFMSNTSLDGLAASPLESIPELPSQPQPHYKPWERKAVYAAVKLLFHLALISIFETVFFFLYVSSLEDNGIQKTVTLFINGAVNTCKNFTAPERVIANDILNSFMNATVIIQTGNSVYMQRVVLNAHLFDRAWIYVGGICGLFVALVGYVRWRKIPVAWKFVVLEDVTMVLLLAMYEYMFFSTVIFPYAPISSYEIARNAVEDMQSTCGLFTDA